MGVVAAGTTQATAALIGSTGTQAVAATSAAGIRLPVPGFQAINATHWYNEIYVVVHVDSSPAASLKLYPQVGDAFPDLGLNAPYILARDTGVILIQGCGKQGSWAVIPFPASGSGSVTSVGISTSSGGVTVGGGPITGSGTLTVDIDAGLSALAALTGTNTIYYRSAANTWTAVSIGSGLSFTGGTLAASGGGGTVTSVAIATSSFGLFVGGGPISGAGTLTVNLDGDLDNLVGFPALGTIPYGDGAHGWNSVTIGTGLTFAGGTLSATAAAITSGQTVCTAFNITGATTVYQATGNTIPIPGAGTYLITGKIRGVVQPASNAVAYVKRNSATSPTRPTSPIRKR